MVATHERIKETVDLNWAKEQCRWLINVLGDDLAILQRLAPALQNHDGARFRGLSPIEARVLSIAATERIASIEGTIASLTGQVADIDRQIADGQTVAIVGKEG